MKPSWTKSPRTRDIISWRYSDDPGMPMAECVYTRSPLKGVCVPRYCIEDFAIGIWKKLLVRSDFIKYFHCASFRSTSLVEVDAVGRIRVYWHKSVKAVIK